MRYLVTILILSLRVVTTYGQSAADFEKQYHTRNALAKGAMASPLEDNYDVRGVKIDLVMTNLNTSLSGNSITWANVVAAAGMGQYVFELDTALIIDSMKINGAIVSATPTGGFLRTVTLGTPLSFGTSFIAQVWYHGTPPSGTGFFTRGVNHNVISGTGTQITFTLSDQYLAKDWWPCKQSLQDKIDSAIIWITVPAGLKAGCNGLLKGVTPIGSNNRYEWKTTYPIEYYLIAASVAPYTDYSRYMHFTGSPDSMLLQHYLYDTATLRPTFQLVIDSIGSVVNYFSSLFGRYPFIKEKYGHCYAPLSGGMEHQTMTTIGTGDLTLASHELGHQWWGDAVTYRTWKDIWLSEGWASYCEQLFTERFSGATSAMNYRTGVYNYVMSQAGGSVIVDDTTNVNRIFDSRLTYNKGAAVAHMLRYVAPSDVLFFTALRTYQSMYKYSTATTADLKQVLETAYGHNLDTFFNQWVYGEGYPTYTADWNQSGNTIYVKLTQTASKPSVTALFATPLEIKLMSSTGDTVVKVYNNTSVQIFTFQWGRTMVDLFVDPDNQILNKVSAVNQDPTLSVHSERTTNGIHVFPNPAKDEWTVVNLPKNVELRLFSSEGKEVWKSGTVKDSIKIPTTGLPVGLYQLVISSGGKEIDHYLLQHL